MNTVVKKKHLFAVNKMYTNRKFSIRVQLLHSLFSIRTSKFGAEAERSYLFLQFEAENVLKMFLNLHSVQVSLPC